MKKRIAIWIHGGIGGGNFSQGQPVIGKLVAGLAMNYEVIVYSQLLPNKEFIAQGFTIHSASENTKLPWFRWLYLLLIFFNNHFKKPHQLIYSFWGYPAGLFAVALGRLFRKPSVIHLQGGDSVCMPEFRYGVFYGFMSRKLSFWSYTHSSLLIALTQFQKKNLESFGIKRRIEIIPYGPDLSMFNFHRNKFQNDRYRFIHIGNHNPLKDQATLLNAFRIISDNLKNCNLRIVGYDALNGELKKFSVQLGIDDSVEFIDQAPYEEIPGYLYNADVILHTSLFEGQATVISEAAAAGVLLAGTRVGLLSDLGDRYGLIVNVGDAQTLAEKVLNALKDLNVVFAYIRNAREWVEEHDHQWTIDRITSHIQKLTHK